MERASFVGPAPTELILLFRRPNSRGSHPMRLRLVATNNGRAIAIRDHVLPLLRQGGAIQVQRDAVRVTELRIGVWMFRLWTPFNELSREEASSPGYRRAIERQRTRKALPYGLDIWYGTTKVLQMLWSDDDETIEVMIFVQGPWADQVLLLQRCDIESISILHKP